MEADAVEEEGGEVLGELQEEEKAGGQGWT